MVDQQSDVPATQSPTATSAVPIVSAAGDGDSINQIAEAYVNKHIVVVGILCAISIAVLAYVYILTGTIVQPFILIAMAYALGFYIIYQAAERQFMQELARELACFRPNAAPQTAPMSARLAVGRSRWTRWAVSNTRSSGCQAVRKRWLRRGCATS